ncbi:hypothetical protein BB559_003092 [Furculomyces boomerangus]|uniref:AAA+ ATPase domain-containing protein n=1 Tax=Furculomyces boomerangus TaxID=61424 RepID=A0A2T9YP49_9FUNG|nr:hypothetical protein BB559_003092 [Furculomyces boomerangus]
MMNTRKVLSAVNRKRFGEFIRYKTTIVTSEEKSKAAQLFEGLANGDRMKLSKAITMIESTRSDHRRISAELISMCLKESGKKNKKQKRIGFTGTPGVGKSTFIETFGKKMIENGHRLAAVDPSSARSGGSILGDKTRMPYLSVADNAYVRPSPNKGDMGGVTKSTLETIILTEAAGYDTCFVETVGVGQSEFMVSEMVDMFVLLSQPGAGDTLQGIKKGIMELADLIIVNKSDGNLEIASKRTSGNLIDALRFVAPKSADWNPQVIRTSCVSLLNIDRIYDTINLYFDKIEKSKRWDKIRTLQQRNWMWRQINNLIIERLHEESDVSEAAESLEKRVLSGEIAPTTAAYEIVDLFLNKPKI